MLREDTRVAAISTYLIHSRNISSASWWIRVTKAAGGVPREIRERCTATRRVHAAPTFAVPFLFTLSFSYFFATRIRELFDFFLSLDARTRSGSVRREDEYGIENERVEEEEEEEEWELLLRKWMRRAAMHWRRRVKLSFSHNSLESSPLNSVIGCAIATGMRYRLR